MSSKRKRREDEDEEPPSKRIKMINYSDSESEEEEEEETEEDKRQRRLNKKLAKQAKIAQNERDNYFGYSAENNPFGDPNLTSVFIWKKKYDAHGLSDRDIKQIQKKRIKDKQQILKQEILKTKQRREQRERDKELEERLHAELAKEMELEENAGWQEKEEEFHQLNAVKRSQIRIEQNRWTAIDILAINIIGFKIDTKHHHKIRNPVNLINELSLSDLAQLLNDINEYIANHLIGNEEKEKDHWNMGLLYVEYVFDKKNLIENYIENEENPHQNKMISDMNIMDKIERENLLNQSYDELVKFEDLCCKMSSGRQSEIDQKYAQISVDHNYWALALKIAKICKAKAFIIKQHKILIGNLKKEKEEKTKTMAMTMKMHSNDNNNNNSSESNSNNKAMTKFSIPELLQQEQINDDDIPMIDSSHSLYTIYKTKAIDIDDDWEEIEELRIKVLKQTMEKLEKQGLFKDNNNNKEKEKETKESESEIIDNRKETEMYQREASRTMDDGEHSYNNSEERIPSELRTRYWWHDKYRPRKPRYFNRVKTGYSWNKYNQTHYDPDNPPPKIVQGYKFNIFYPDLIDSSSTPRYKLYEKDSSEYAILIFHSGPPYQDIAFKIVNNEWEPSHRRGFRCRFEKGIFSLYFNFKRYRYRR